MLGWFKAKRDGTDEFYNQRSWGPAPHYPTVQSIPIAKQDALLAIAGPCSIEDERTTRIIARTISQMGGEYMRGGVFRAGTYPPKDFGLVRDKWVMFSDVARGHGLKTVVEVLDVSQLGWFEGAGMIQVGARHMQDYALLNELGKWDKPVLLKRNMGATLDEFLGAAEYLVKDGKRDVWLVERGSSTHMRHVRWDLSCSVIAAVKRITGLPILVDASHGTGRRDLVLSMTLAGLAAGADGYIVEVHPNPYKSLSDAEQAFPLDLYEEFSKRCQKIWEVIHER